MLGQKNYPQAYIDACKAKIARDVEKFAETKASAELEAIFFENLVLVLEQMFVHRLRGVEGKDGNPLNEVRMLAASILTNNGLLEGDKTIKWTPEKTVLKLAVGDKIALTKDHFSKLEKAFFAELEKKFA